MNLTSKSGSGGPRILRSGFRVLGNVRCRPSLAADPARVEGAAADALFLLSLSRKDSAWTLPTATADRDRAAVVENPAGRLRHRRRGRSYGLCSARVARFGPVEREDPHASPAAR